MARRVYIDVCCLHRCFDDQSQPRVRSESDAMRIVFAACEQGVLAWVASEAVENEARRNPNGETRSAILGVVSRASERVRVDDAAVQRAREFVAGGLRGMDALHAALAETARCDILLTTDDRFAQHAARLGVKVKVMNPVALRKALVHQ